MEQGTRKKFLKQDTFDYCLLIAVLAFSFHVFLIRTSCMPGIDYMMRYKICIKTTYA